MNDICHILTTLSKDPLVNNDKLFSTMMGLYLAEGICEELSEDELNSINEKYGYDLVEILDDNKNAVLESLYNYMELLNISATVVECWLDNWVDCDDITLFTLYEDDDDYEILINDGYNIGDYIYEKGFNNYVDAIIPVVLDYYYKVK